MHVLRHHPLTQSFGALRCRVYSPLFGAPDTLAYAAPPSAFTPPHSPPSCCERATQLELTMYWEFSSNPPPGVPSTVNVFFVILSFAVAVTGAYTALQFTEALVNNQLQMKSSQRRGGTVLTLIAAAFSIATLTIWIMHFTSMISVKHPGYEIMYELWSTIASMLYIFVAALIAYAIFMCHRRGVFGDPDVSELIQTYYSRPDDDAGVAEHLRHLWSQVKAAAGWRLILAGTIVGLGVYAMHFQGMMAMRSPRLGHYYNPILVGLTAVIGIVGGSAVIFLLFTMHGLRRRVVASVVLGVAVMAVHWQGYYCATVAPPPGGLHMMHAFSSEILVDAEIACIVVMLLSSIIRFAFMGIVAASAE
ncbi:hypothetical protein EON66_00080 [archaeon]|nr:MAG: hypothetical protein EON66_00080 [archaeon]